MRTGRGWWAVVPEALGVLLALAAVTLPAGTAQAGGTLSPEGHTWSRAFRSGGTELYECWPHSSLGMRGGIFIDENPDSGPEYGINETESDTQTEGNETPGDSNASGNETPSENQTTGGNQS